MTLSEVMATPSTEVPSPMTPLLSRTKTWDLASPGETRNLGYGRKGNKMHTTPKPAVGPNPKNSFFGTSERMEPGKWNKYSRMVEKEVLGGHYNYLAAGLADPLGEDEQQRLHDEVLADALHKRRPSEAAHPLADRPQSPMRTAFTDRSLRLREGRSGRTTLMSKEPLTTEWASHVDCACEVCHPSSMRAAGNSSHHVHYNKVNRCYKDSTPTQPPWESDIAQHLDSGKVNLAMEHITGSTPSPPAHEERAFIMNMGRKVKSSRPQSPGAGRSLDHFSFLDDPTIAAGRYKQDSPPEIMMHSCKGRQAWQGRRSASPPRSGVSYVMDPHAEDPPAPSRILAARKADGVFKQGNTKQAEDLTNYFNQDVFRFSDPGFVRGRSVSPPRFDSAAGIGTGQWTGNPGSSPRRHQSPPSSPAKQFRSLMCNNSSIMASVMNIEAGEHFFAQESAARMKLETPFVELCNTTSAHHELQCSLADGFKQSHGHGKCAASDEMAWREH
jgi:hypothetical protein